MSHESYQTVLRSADLPKGNAVMVGRWIRVDVSRAIDIGKGWRIGAEERDAFFGDRAVVKGNLNMAPDGSVAQNTKEQKN
jgi:hypothetical protein